MARLTGGQFYNTDVTIDGIAGEGGGSCGRDASRELIRATAQDTALAVGVAGCLFTVLLMVVAFKSLR